MPKIHVVSWFHCTMYSLFRSNKMSNFHIKKKRYHITLDFLDMHIQYYNVHNKLSLHWSESPNFSHSQDI